MSRATLVGRPGSAGVGVGRLLWLPPSAPAVTPDLGGPRSRRREPGVGEAAAAGSPDRGCRRAVSPRLGDGEPGRRRDRGDLRGAGACSRPIPGSSSPRWPPSTRARRPRRRSTASRPSRRTCSPGSTTSTFASALRTCGTSGGASSTSCLGVSGRTSIIVTARLRLSPRTISIHRWWPSSARNWSPVSPSPEAPRAGTPRSSRARSGSRSSSASARRSMRGSTAWTSRSTGAAAGSWSTPTDADIESLVAASTTEPSAAVPATDDASIAGHARGERGLGPRGGSGGRGGRGRASASSGRSCCSSAGRRRRASTSSAALYRRIAAALPGRPVVFRTLDIGGDKPASYLPADPEMNPALGVRGLRLGLSQPELLETQLRALLEADPASPLRLLLPMVATVEEVAAARRGDRRARLRPRAGQARRSRTTFGSGSWSRSRRSRSSPTPSPRSSTSSASGRTISSSTRSPPIGRTTRSPSSRRRSSRPSCAWSGSSPTRRGRTAGLSRSAARRRRTRSPRRCSSGSASTS